MDPRIENLSKLLVEYSCRVQEGENVLIEYEGENCKDLARQLVKDVYRNGGSPFVNISDSAVSREILLGCEQDQLSFMREYKMKQMEGMQAYIAVRGSNNSSELADVPPEKLGMYDRELLPVLDKRVNDTKWVILRYPNPSMAQLAGTSTEAFADFFFRVCTMDYAKMNEAMDPLKELMERTDKVRLKGPGTDLTFSIKGMNAVRDFVDEYLENAGDSEEKTRVIDKLVSEIEQEKLKKLVAEIEEYIEGTRICFEDLNTENEDD